METCQSSEEGKGLWGPNSSEGSLQLGAGRWVKSECAEEEIRAFQAGGPTGTKTWKRE